MSHQANERPDASSPPPPPVERPHRLRAALDRGPGRAFLVGLFALGLLVFLPAIRAPFLLDDYLHRAMANGVFPAPRGPFDFYDFVSDGDRAALLDRGILPWWTDPSLEIRFFRPLSSLLLYADHRSFGGNPVLLHAHSFLWWALAVLAVRALFLRFFSPRIALVGTAVFALAPCHALPLAWLANREALVSLAFGLSALGRYEDFRAAPSWRGALFTAVLFALALLAGEYALLLGGYVLALEIYREKATIRARIVGLLPFVVPVLGYLAARRMLGYGTRGSGFYSDPTREPIAYLHDAPRRLFTLISDAWLSLDGDAVRSTTPLAVLVIGALVIGAFVLGPIHASLAALPDRSRRFGKAMLLGSFASLLPVLSVVPSPRLLEAAVVGIAATVAIVFEHAFATPEAGTGAYPRGERTALAALGLVFFHLVHAPITSWTSSRTIQKGGMRFAYYADKLAQRLAKNPDSELIVVRGFGSAFFVPFAITPSGAPPRKVRILAHTGHVLVNRDSATTLTLTVPPESTLFPIGHGNLFRTEHAKVAAGAVLVGQRMRAEVLEVGSEGPTHVRFVFDAPPDDALWISETQKGFPETPVPEPGFGSPFDP